MKKTLNYGIIIIFFILLVVSTGAAREKKDLFEILKPTKIDIPKGFVFGKIPPFAKKIFKENPWVMDNLSIRKLTSKIYPGGDYNSVLRIHMTIFAKQKKPYGDDIVCYIIQYKTRYLKNIELTKIKNHVKYNQDRSLMIEKNNIIIYMHSDSIEDFGEMEFVVNKIRDKIENTERVLIKSVN